MTTAVFAHFDPHGQVSPHVLRHIAALDEVADRVIVVSSAPLSQDGRDVLRAAATLIERDNVGYDFGSWAHVVGPMLSDRSSAAGPAEDLILTNDSTLGPLRPYSELFLEVSARAGGVLPDVLGPVLSEEIDTHLQSFFLRFSGRVVGSEAFGDFWRSFEPLDNRLASVKRYEVGLSQMFRAEGVPLVAVFEPSARARAVSAYLCLTTPEERSAPAEEAYVMESIGDPRPSNLMIGAWDCALDGSLPWIKLETLRDDPYRVGAELMIERLAARWPDHLADVRELIDRTRDDLVRLRDVRTWRSGGPR